MRFRGLGGATPIGGRAGQRMGGRFLGECAGRRRLRHQLLHGLRKFRHRHRLAGAPVNYLVRALRGRRRCWRRHEAARCFPSTPSRDLAKHLAALQ